MAKLSKRLSKIKAKYWSEVLTAEEFIDSVSNTIQMSIKEAQQIITNFSREEHAEFDQFKEFLLKAMAGKKPKRISVLHGKVGAWAWAIARPIQHESLAGDELGHGGVDDFADAYERRFNLRFSAFQEWQALREASFRRNIVIHNRG